jgi:hypothetical protein
VNPGAANRGPIDHANVVLTSAGSPQLIGMLRRQYGAAQIIVVELEDWEFDIDLPGPVKRILSGGEARCPRRLPSMN